MRLSALIGASRLHKRAEHHLPCFDALAVGPGANTCTCSGLNQQH